MDVLKKVFLNKMNYIFLFVCIVILGIIRYKDIFKISFLILCLKLSIACFIGAFIGELIAKFIYKKLKNN